MKFYRYDTVGESIGSLHVGSLREREYEMVSETEKGYWINVPHSPYHTRKWVSKSAKKRFAYPTKEEALDSFLARSKRRLKFLTRDIAYVEGAIFEAEKIKRGR